MSSATRQSEHECIQRMQHKSNLFGGPCLANASYRCASCSVHMDATSFAWALIYGNCSYRRVCKECKSSPGGVKPDTRTERHCTKLITLHGEKQMSKLLRSHKDLAEFLGAEATEQSLDRRVYKNTECGAWLLFIGDEGVKLGSIVEGTERCCIPAALKYPFTVTAFRIALKYIEDQASDIWDETHGCDHCGMDGAINPACDFCHGEGIIL